MQFELWLFQKEALSVHRKQAGRRVIPRTRLRVQAGNVDYAGRKCRSMDGVLDSPRLPPFLKSLSMDDTLSETPKPRTPKRTAVVRRRSSRLSHKSCDSVGSTKTTGSTTGTSCSCKYCGKIFTSRAGLYYHLPVHTGKYKLHCQVCKAGFMDTIKYRNHLQQHCKCEDQSQTSVKSGDQQSHSGNNQSEPATEAQNPELPHSVKTDRQLRSHVRQPMPHEIDAILRRLPPPPPYPGLNIAGDEKENNPKGLKLI